MSTVSNSLNFKTFFSKYIFDPSSNELTKQEKVVAWIFSVLLLVGIGVALKKLSCWVWSRCFCSPTSNKVQDVAKKHFGSERDLIEALRQHNGLEPKECGAEGKCLLYSIAYQISDQEFSHAFARAASIFEQAKFERCIREGVSLTPLAQQNFSWSNCSNTEKADILRVIAMAYEWKFSQGNNALNLSQGKAEFWIEELFKDMLQEVSVSGCSYSKHSPIPDNILNCSFDLKRQRVEEWFKKYLETTIQMNSWSGSSEMIALSLFFQRPILAYGNDGVSGHVVQKDQEGKLIPYFTFVPSEETVVNPIRIFQCNGGGHYNALVSSH